MPTASNILTWATDAANDFRIIAIFWHLAAALLLIVLPGRVRRSPRLAARLLVLPLLSVSLIAGLSRNPFNAAIFAVGTLVLLRAAAFLPRDAVATAHLAWRAPGVALVVLGLVYPHFLVTDNWLEHVYAAPFGVLPCPTLAVLVGITLLRRDLHAANWSAPVAVAGVTYGFIGVLMLDVVLDLWLIAGSLALLATIAADVATRRGQTREQWHWR